MRFKTIPVICLLALLPTLAKASDSFNITFAADSSFTGQYGITSGQTVWCWLNSPTVKVGFVLPLGGEMGWLSLANSSYNLSVTDPGRSIQQSYYSVWTSEDTPVEDQVVDEWNPNQAQGSGGFGKVTAISLDGAT
jgi:hypothetical protein